MYRLLTTLMVSMILFSACGGQDATQAKPDAKPKNSVSTQASDDIPMTNMPSLKIGPYSVQPMFEEVIENGHYNIKITGGDVAAVRIWVGPEDASGVMVVKTEIENDYNHGHVEVPKPIPADARLWIEIETPGGEKLKGSTPLKAA